MQSADLTQLDHNPHREIHNITLSIIIPVYNEESMLSSLHDQLCEVISNLTVKNSEIIYVNDGSSDKSWEIIQQLAVDNVSIHGVNLSRNFGKEAALTAGLDYATGEAVVILDADLQDPPELIQRMLDKWQEGYDVVNMKRGVRLGESRFKLFMSSTYYRLFSVLSDVEIQGNVGDFRLLSRRIVDHIRQLPERTRYMKGIMAWPGFRQVTISFDRQPRMSGGSKWSFFQLLGLGVAGITAFSIKPLRLATLAGITVSAAAFIYSVFVLFKTLYLGDNVAGYPSLMIVHLWLSGVQLITIGMLGEYIGRIFIESKARPIYLVMDTYTRGPKK